MVRECSATSSCSLAFLLPSFPPCSPMLLRLFFPPPLPIAPPPFSSLTISSLSLLILPSPCSSCPPRWPLALLALDDCDGPQLDALLGDVCVVTRLNDLAHVLVTLRGLLHDQLGRCHADLNTSHTQRFVQTPELLHTRTCMVYIHTHPSLSHPVTDRQHVQTCPLPPSVSSSTTAASPLGVITVRIHCRPDVHASLSLRLHVLDSIHTQVEREEEREAVPRRWHRSSRRGCPVLDT